MSKDKNIADLRQSYEKGSLDVSTTSSNPRHQFDQWFDDVLQSGITEANAMTLATCGQDGQPSSRIVLLKGIIDEGYIFYTNYDSLKGQQLAENNKASLLFFWKELERQVRIEGVVHKVTPEQSTEYFKSRPKGSQIGAWSSPQSHIITRDALDKRVSAIEAKFAHLDALPLPPFWGGYILKPHFFEFWQGRKNRLHDRITYRLNQDNAWNIQRIAP